MDGPLTPAGWAARRLCEDVAVDAHELEHRLSRISTCWSMVAQAHEGPADAVARAQQGLVQRYLPAIYRYLLGALRDADAADEVAQEFALRLVRGDFKRADPDRGRFRDYVKTSLYHLIVNHQKGARGRAQPLAEPSAVADSDPDTAESDRAFLDRWREELLNRAWEELEQNQARTGQPFYTVLRFRADNPGLPSAQMAEQLSARLGKPLTDAGVRQTLHRARKAFAALLVEEVGRSLQTDDAERIEQELIDLDLHAYCHSALRQRDRKAP
jgi:RNA polymerase sigma-70 factor (ECF subfamily)